MRRVAITGIGITSSIGNNVDEYAIPRQGVGIEPGFAELGRSRSGTVKMDIADHVDRKRLRFMGMVRHAVIAGAGYRR